MNLLSRRATWAITVIGISCLPICVRAQDTAESISAAEKFESVVYAIRGSSARDISRTLQEFYGVPHQGNVTVVPSVEGNIVLIRCKSSMLKEVLDVVSALDPMPAIIRVNVRILAPQNLSSDEISQLSGKSENVTASLTDFIRSGKVRLLEQLELSALENQTASMQVGGVVEQVTGVTITNGRTMRNYSSVNVGTMLEIETRVTSNRAIAIDVHWNRSVLKPGEQVSSDDPYIPSSVITNTQQTTLLVNDGHTVLVAGAGSADQLAGDTLMLVSASVEGSKAGDTRSLLNLSSRTYSPVRDRDAAPARQMPDTLRSRDAPRGISRPDVPRPGAAPVRRPTTSRPTTSRQRDGDRGATPATRDQPRSSQAASGLGANDDRRRRYAELLFQKLDQDKDGKLDKKEFIYKSATFEEADLNDDGKIQLEELSELLLGSGDR